LLEDHPLDLEGPERDIEWVIAEGATGFAVPELTTSRPILAVL
jgi:hypothetical protein